MALYQHLEGTQHLNPQLDWSNGAVFFQGRPLAAYQEKVQLFFKASGCKPGVVHYRLLTPARVTRGANLMCCFCNDDYKYNTEQQVGRALLAAGLDTQTTWQCVPPGGGSVVDFYNFTAQLVIQADGTAHTQGVRPALKPSKLLQQDINKCVAAWHKGLKYMRVQHGDMEGSELLPTAPPGAPPRRVHRSTPFCCVSLAPPTAQTRPQTPGPSGSCRGVSRAVPGSVWLL